MLKYKSGQLYSIYKCVHLIFSSFSFLLCALRVSASYTFNLETVHSCLLSISQCDRENSVRQTEKRASSPAHQEVGYCDQVSTFFLWAGVNPPQLVGSLQGLYFWGDKAACVGSLLLPNRAICYWGYTPSRNLSMLFKLWACTMYLTLFKSRGCPAPGKKRRKCWKSHLFPISFTLLYWKAPAFVDQNTYCSPFFPFHSVMYTVSC